MTDFARVAKEVFQILNTFDYTVQMYNNEGMDVIEPKEARRFYASKPRSLAVAIVDADDNSCVNLFYGKNTHVSDIDGLIQTMRETTTKYALGFSAQQYEREITPKDFSSLAAITEGKQDKMTIISSLTEGMYGTTRSSYLQQENARMIVRHSKRIDDSVIGARGRCIEQIFIENAAGERLLFPSDKIAPARAMTQHVSQGGTFNDSVGGQIIGMTNDYSNLGHATSYMAGANNLQEGALAVREACRNNRKSLRKTFERLSKPSTYAKECAKIKEAGMLAETNQEIDETRISEVRRLLNDADLPRSVYECCCKAMDKMKESITEDEGEETEPEQKAPEYIPTTVGVFGRRVDKKAWDELKLGKLELKQARDIVSNDKNPRFTSGYSELCYKLGNLIPKVANDSLGNLLDYVLTRLTDYSENRFRPTKEHSVDEKVGQWKTLAVHALKAAHIPVGSNQLAKESKVIRKYMEWLDTFNPDRVLMEYGLNPYSRVSNQYGRSMDTGDAQERATDDAIANFDAQEFIDSEYMTDILRDRDPENPDDNVVDRTDIMSALKSYLSNSIETQSEYFDNGFNDDQALEATAKAVANDVIELLQNEGFVVDGDNFNVEDNGTDDDVEDVGIEGIEGIEDEGLDLADSERFPEFTLSPEDIVKKKSPMV